MVTLFISYHPDDAPVVAQVLDWLDPFRYKYFLRICFNRYDANDPENKLEYTHTLHNAHIYLFLTSHKWVQDRGLQREVEVALDRLHADTDQQITVLPFQVKPCAWRNFSKLVEVEDQALPLPKLELIKIDPRDVAYQLLTERLSTIIEPLRDRLIQDAKLKGLPTHQFFEFTQTPKEKAPRKGAIRFSMDDLRRWIMIAALLFVIWSLYQMGCNAEPFR